jgi:hypothetical protein
VLSFPIPRIPPLLAHHLASARKKPPELTLDRTVRLLGAAFEEPELKLPRAIALVDYHVRRNEAARKSHAKTWRANHRGVKFLRL